MINAPSGLWAWFLTALVAGMGWTLGCQAVWWVIGFVKARIG